MTPWSAGWRAGDVVWQEVVNDKYNIAKEEDDSVVLDGNDEGFDIAGLPGGGYVLAGWSYGSVKNPDVDQEGHFEPWVAYLSANGELLTSTVHRVPSGAAADIGQAVAVSTGGGALVAGRLATLTTDMFTHEDVLLIQGGAYRTIGSSGGNTTLNPSSGGVGQAALAATHDGGYILVATSSSDALDPDMRIVKLGPTDRLAMPGLGYPTGSQSDNSEFSIALEMSDTTFAAPLVVAPPFADIGFESTPPAGTWLAP